MKMISEDKHRIDKLIFIWTLFITSIGLLVRSWIRSNEILVFIGDCFGNIGGVIVASFLFFWIVKEINFRRRAIIVISVGTGFVIYEFLQYFLPWMTYDINDLFGTLIGIMITIFVIILIEIIVKKGSFRAS